MFHFGNQKVKMRPGELFWHHASHTFCRLRTEGPILKLAPQSLEPSTFDSGSHSNTDVDSLVPSLSESLRLHDSWSIQLRTFSNLPPSRSFTVYSRCLIARHEPSMGASRVGWKFEMLGFSPASNIHESVVLGEFIACCCCLRGFPLLWSRIENAGCRRVGPGDPALSTLVAVRRSSFRSIRALGVLVPKRLVKSFDVQDLAEKPPSMLSGLRSKPSAGVYRVCSAFIAEVIRPSASSSSEARIEWSSYPVVGCSRTFHALICSI